MKKLSFPEGFPFNFCTVCGTVLSDADFPLCNKCQTERL